ncbi:MAG: hypothetical protein GX594_11000 [Pirellulaceae bacterium]|nr:hypothetical protein [Pirellulaceae bacterium]
MDLTRNQFFFAGLLCLFLGGQFRMIDTVQLTGEFTAFLAERTHHPLASVNSASQTLMQSSEPPAKKSFKPPEWLGWSLLSIGSVLVLHSWGMKKPDG